MDTVDLFDQTNGSGEVEDDEVEEELSAGEVLARLEEAWINEKQAPELLQPKMEIVECMMEQVGSVFKFSRVY